ncbi:unnamed protein product [Brachionus calyciflorus]|uniref:Delta-aminolevulinic acid dehydratase n=1 Tax=Brachionus calyciflorus TaxID=104777 RepID=A0A813M5Y8_9BILA|nr:unnamed protein product [Brachionus calyciflorus]
MNSQNFNSNHVLQGGYFHKTIRRWQSTNILVDASNFIFPLFVHENDETFEEIPSLPNIYRIGLNKLRNYLEPIVNDGLTCVLLFGVIDSDSLKDESGSYADNQNSSVLRAIPKLREWFPDLLIACDVCLCAYTFHGHCGVFSESKSLSVDSCINRENSVERIAQVALAFAKAGAHVVAPSDMMDGRIDAIRNILNQNNMLNRVSVMSYSTKFASAFYGPFRDAAKSAPAFGDRRCYQLPAGSTGLAIRASERDVQEGADILMVKPCMSYLDIVKELKQTFPHHPLAVYQVSGEYAMIWHGAKANSFDLRMILIEIIHSLRRSGADIIISYYTPMILKWIKENKFSLN